MPKAEHREANHKSGTKQKMLTKQGTCAEEHPNIFRSSGNGLRRERLTKKKQLEEAAATR
jgi:hypothetical protein